MLCWLIDYGLSLKSKLHADVVDEAFPEFDEDVPQFFECVVQSGREREEGLHRVRLVGMFRGYSHSHLLRDDLSYFLSE